MNDEKKLIFEIVFFEPLCFRLKDMKEVRVRVTKIFRVINLK